MGSPDKAKNLKFGKRHILTIWLFTGMLVLYILRFSLNTAIISMAKPDNSTEISALDLNNRTDICPVSEPEVVNNNSNSTSKEGEFDWDHTTRGVILSSFFYGYICTNLFGGYFTRVFGGRIVFGLGIAGSAILTLLTPIAARTDTSFLIAIRVILGLFQGLIYPCCYHVLASWIPTQERSVLVTLAVTGADIGIVLAAPLTGVLCEYGFDGGWPSAFYVWGAVGLLWSAGWFYFVRDSPAEHPTISAEERRYIEENSQSTSAKPVPFTQIPWKSMALSIPFWAVAIGQTAHSWVYYTMIAEISTYMKDVLHISASLNGLLACLPYICVFVVEMAAAFISDFARSKGVPTKWVRKCCHVFGMYSAAIILICFTYAGCNTTIVVVMLCLGIGMTGFGYGGYIANLMDIAPQYAGLIMGFTNTVSQMPGIIAPIIAGAIVNEESTISTWQTVFYISAGISVGGSTLFAIMADGEVQPWAKVAEQETAPKEPAIEVQPVGTHCPEKGDIGYF